LSPKGLSVRALPDSTDWPLHMSGGHVPTDCVCAVVCPDYGHCACMYIYEENRCACTCQNRPGPLPLEVQAQFTRLDAMVNFDLRGATLSEIGSLLADLVDADFYLPAHRLEESQEFLLEAVPLQTIISALGVIAVPRSAARLAPQ
jgi:hypothetical protein